MNNATETTQSTSSLPEQPAGADSFLYHRYYNLPLPALPPSQTSNPCNPLDSIDLPAFPLFEVSSAKNSIAFPVLTSLNSLLTALFSSRSGIGDGLSGWLTGRESDRLSRILTCRYITRMGKTCGCCPACLSRQSRLKVFVDLKAERKRLEREVADLKQLRNFHKGFLRSVKGKADEARIRGWKKTSLALARRHTWLAGCVGREDSEIALREAELLRLQPKNRWECKDKAKLFRAWHCFVSCSLPEGLRGLFSVDDGFLPNLSLDCDKRRTNPDVRGALGLMAGKALDCGAGEFFRDLLRRLLAAEIEGLFPGITLAYVEQVHSCGLYYDAPDVHFLICCWGMGATGQPVRVSIDERNLNEAVQRAYRKLVSVAVWGSRRWSGGCRLKAFSVWREGLESALVALDAGLPDDCVDVRLVLAKDLLTVQRYMRRMPMERLRSLSCNLAKNEVMAGFWKAGQIVPVRMTVTQFLKRLAGCDGRQGSLRVSFNGLYAENGTGKRREAFRGLAEGIRELSEKAIVERRQRRTPEQPALSPDVPPSVPGGIVARPAGSNALSGQRGPTFGLISAKPRNPVAAHRAKKGDDHDTAGNRPAG